MIRALQPGDVDACARLLDCLPNWFGLAEANAAYVESLHRLPGFVAVDDGRLTGFVAVEQHFPHAAEITVMGVESDHHREGIGRALVDAAEQWCADHDVEWLHVKTRGPATFDADYERTRRFYTGIGFAPLYESLTEWGPENAALILVKQVPPQAGAPRAGGSGDR